MAHPATSQHPSIAKPYTTGEVCAVLRCTPQTLRLWEKAGRIPQAARIGRRKLWPAGTVERLLAAHAGGAQ